MLVLLSIVLIVCFRIISLDAVNFVTDGDFESASWPALWAANCDLYGGVSSISSQFNELACAADGSGGLELPSNSICNATATFTTDGASAPYFLHILFAVKSGWAKYGGYMRAKFEFLDGSTGILYAFDTGEVDGVDRGAASCTVRHGRRVEHKVTALMLGGVMSASSVRITLYTSIRGGGPDRVFDGLYVGTVCSPYNVNCDSCTPACANGGSCGFTTPNVCECTNVWTGEDCMTPVCTSNCSGHGVCVSGDVCDCTNPYVESGDASDCQYCGDAVVSGDEQCDGGACCDAGTCTFLSGGASNVCRAAAHAECDKVEYCTGTSGACPTDQFESFTTPCTDNNDCTAPDYCSGSDATCVSGPAVPMCTPTPLQTTTVGATTTTTSPQTSNAGTMTATESQATGAGTTLSLPASGAGTTLTPTASDPKTTAIHGTTATEGDDPVASSTSGTKLPMVTLPDGTFGTISTVTNTQSSSVVVTVDGTALTGTDVLSVWTSSSSSVREASESTADVTVTPDNTALSGDVTAVVASVVATCICVMLCSGSVICLLRVRRNRRRQAPPDIQLHVPPHRRLSQKHTRAFTRSRSRSQLPPSSVSTVHATVNTVSSLSVPGDCDSLSPRARRRSRSPRPHYDITPKAPMAYHETSLTRWQRDPLPQTGNIDDDDLSYYG